jgi:hypothetical protein
MLKGDESALDGAGMVHLGARKHCTRQGGRMVGCMRIGRTRTRGHKYWGMGSEARNGC